MNDIPTSYENTLNTLLASATKSHTLSAATSSGGLCCVG
jgi:hypothetical protein